VGTIGNDLNKIAECEWIIEAVLEDVSIKKNLYNQVAIYRKPGSFLTTNTSSINIGLLAQDLPVEIRTCFLGTHFFNPPRYLPLLEIIPGKETDKKIVDFFYQFGAEYLGKTTVLCKDAPGFIANRLGVFAICHTLHLAEELQLSITEIDALTGSLMGRPKSATYRTADVVGIDTLLKVADFLYQNTPEGYWKTRFNVPEWVKKMVSEGKTGDKSGSGFYKASTTSDGKKQFLVINSSSGEYEEGTKTKIDKEVILTENTGFKETLITSNIILFTKFYIRYIMIRYN
jgi:3-hydroxyacyl-CoA dehydrogenase